MSFRAELVCRSSFTNDSYLVLIERKHCGQRQSLIMIGQSKKKSSLLCNHTDDCEIIYTNDFYLLFISWQT